MKNQSFNISLPKELVKKIDEVAKKEYRNRSELIREAVWVYLQKVQRWEEIFKAGREAGRKAGVKSEGDVDRIVYEYRHGRKYTKNSH